MIELAITFGTIYGREPHPVDGRIHPDGWVVVEGEDYADARAQASAVFDNRFAFDYPLEGEFAIEREFFPRGEIGRIRHGVLTMAVETQEA